MNDDLTKLSGKTIELLTDMEEHADLIFKITEPIIDTLGWNHNTTTITFCLCLSRLLLMIDDDTKPYFWKILEALQLDCLK